MRAKVIEDILKLRQRNRGGESDISRMVWNAEQHPLSAMLSKLGISAVNGDLESLEQVPQDVYANILGVMTDDELIMEWHAQACCMYR